MLGDAVGPRDLSGLQLPLLGHVDRDERGGWQVFGADGEPMSAVTWFWMICRLRTVQIQQPVPTHMICCDGCGFLRRSGSSGSRRLDARCVILCAGFDQRQIRSGPGVSDRY